VKHCHPGVIVYDDINQQDHRDHRIYRSSLHVVLGSEPVLRKLETRFGEQVKIGYIMGGLV
jgi:hypothetical protein